MSSTTALGNHLRNQLSTLTTTATHGMASIRRMAADPKVKAAVKAGSIAIGSLAMGSTTVVAGAYLINTLGVPTVLGVVSEKTLTGMLGIAAGFGSNYLAFKLAGPLGAVSSHAMTSAVIIEFLETDRTLLNAPAGFLSALSSLTYGVMTVFGRSNKVSSAVQAMTLGATAIASFKLVRYVFPIADLGPTLISGIYGGVIGSFVGSLVSARQMNASIAYMNKLDKKRN